MKRMIRYVSIIIAAVLMCPVFSATAADERRVVHLGGMPFGLTMYTGGVIVVNVDEDDESPAFLAGLRENDVITAANGEAVTSNEQLQDIITSCNGADIELSVLRGKSPISLRITPTQDEDGVYTAGMWIRDSTAGLGTITYFDEYTHSFGALGHGICDRDTGMLMPLQSGQAVRAEITSITKAKKGVAGGLNGVMTDETIGEMTINNGYGVYGKYTIQPEGEEFACAYDSDIRTGKATVYTTVDDTGIHPYEVEIISLNLNDKSGQNMVIRVTDEALLAKTGGIIQGMSGSPIVQDDRLVGAVTHVFVNAPEKGYGINIGNMLGCYEQFGGIE
ncbi:SpoIVB peptidase S55 domain-containing protein [Ruminococcus sp.]|uniref:SpoIVB peptidase S55 domain-containing protein n=1 Tax=Ruminococcus sp. TaxID=41978 RepID=UPI00388D85FB